MQKKPLFKTYAQKKIEQNLTRLFNHPGILLFRTRELMALNEYMSTSRLNTDSYVLDLGCGEGKIGNLLFNKIDVGLDIVREDAEEAQKLSTYKRTVIADAKKMPFKSGLFDLVFSNSVIEHIEGIERVLSEVSRVLKPGGLFIFTVPSHKFADYLYLTTFFKRGGLSFLGKTYSEARNRQLSHFNLYNDSEWEKRLERRSFKIVYRKYYLSHREIYEWDKMCLLLRLTSYLPPIHQRSENRSYNKARKLLKKEEDLNIGAGLLVVARK